MPVAMHDMLFSWVIVSLITFNITCAFLTFLASRRKSAATIPTLVLNLLLVIYSFLESSVVLHLSHYAIRLFIFGLVPTCFIGYVVYGTVRVLIGQSPSLRHVLLCALAPTLTAAIFILCTLKISDQEFIALVDSYTQRKILFGESIGRYFIVGLAPMLVQQCFFYLATFIILLRAYYQREIVGRSRFASLLVLSCGPLLLYSADIAILVFNLQLDNSLLALGCLPLYGSVLYLNVKAQEALEYKLEQQKNEMTRYLPADLVRRILSNQGALELQGRRGIGTVMFCDIRNFTTIAEELDPMQVTALLNDYFTEMNGIILKHGGTINKYIGDAIMAVFGQLDRESYLPDVSIACAFEMFQRLDKLNIFWRESGRPEIRIGIGIHRGLMIYGNVGSAERMEYTVIGDTVNTAARVAQLNSTLGIPLIFSSSVLESIDREIPGIRLLGDYDLKGKHKKVRLFGIDTTSQTKLRVVA